MKKAYFILPLLTVSMLVAATTAIAYDDGIVAGPGNEYRDHGRVNELDGRLSKEEHRITQGERNGEFSMHRANALREQLADIRHQEQMYLNEQNGHLKPGQQDALNERLNRVSQEINHDERR